MTFFFEKEILVRFSIGNSTCFQQVDQGHVCNNTNSTKNETTNPLMKFAL